MKKNLLFILLLLFASTQLYAEVSKSNEQTVVNDEEPSVPWSESTCRTTTSPDESGYSTHFQITSSLPNPYDCFLNARFAVQVAIKSLFENKPPFPVTKFEYIYPDKKGKMVCSIYVKDINVDLTVEAKSLEDFLIQKGQSYQGTFLELMADYYRSKMMPLMDLATDIECEYLGT